MQACGAWVGPHSSAAAAAAAASLLVIGVCPDNKPSDKDIFVTEVQNSTFSLPRGFSSVYNVREGL